MTENIVKILSDFADLARPFREWLMVDRFGRKVIITLLRDGSRMVVLSGRWGGYPVNIVTPVSADKMTALEGAHGVNVEDAIAQHLVNEYLSFTSKLVKKNLDGYDSLKRRPIDVSGTLKPELVH